jgi:hypothetical protein
VPSTEGSVFPFLSTRDTALSTVFYMKLFTSACP